MTCAGSSALKPANDHGRHPGLMALTAGLAGLAGFAAGFLLAVDERRAR